MILFAIEETQAWIGLGVVALNGIFAIIAALIAAKAARDARVKVEEVKVDLAQTTAHVGAQ